MVKKSSTKKSEEKQEAKPITNEQMLKELYTDYRFVSAQLKTARQNIRTKGITIESPANGIVRNPAVTVYDTLIKQKLAINKQIMELTGKSDDDGFDELDGLM